MTTPKPTSAAPAAAPVSKPPFRASVDESCTWMAARTGTPWTLARLLEHALTPYVWLDYDAAYPELFGEANGGYAAPIFFEGDIARLLADNDDVLITMTKDAYKIVARLPAPGFTRPRADLRFLGKELERLAGRLQHGATTPTQPSSSPAPAQESKTGIHAAQVLLVFGGLARIDLQQALQAGGGIFGDEGARIKASARKGKAHTMWHPVTLALGLNDVYRVPLGRLGRAFATHDFLHDWQDEWARTLELLGK